MTYKTRGIVLKTTKYGETSLVVTIFTELFGIQTYMVNGVRSSSKRGMKGNIYQPATLLDLVVYHGAQKNIQRIKESTYAYMYKHVAGNVVKNCIALYMVELLNKCLRQPEQNSDLYYFIEDVMLQLDVADATVAANFPLYFALHLVQFFGFKINQEPELSIRFLDLQDGCFTEDRPHHNYFVEGNLAIAVSDILKTLHPDDLVHTKLNRQMRRSLLHHLHDFYALHFSDFGKMKTLSVLHEIL
jgi:DNA repair protein RecO (recombination protein O)